MVNKRLDALSPKTTRTVSPVYLLAAVALELAEDLEASERRIAHLEEQVRKVVHTAIDRIDQRLATDTGHAPLSNPP